MQFNFSGVVDADKRYPIHMELVNLQLVKQECTHKIAQNAPDPFVDINDACLDEHPHSLQCSRAQEWSLPCPRLELEQAEERISRLRLQYHLTACALRPESADGLFTFNGYAQDGYIYDLKWVPS